MFKVPPLLFEHPTFSSPRAWKEGQKHWQSSAYRRAPVAVEGQYFHLKTATFHANGITEVPAYSDTLGTWEKCHSIQIVTVTRGSLVTNRSFGTCQKCHCKRGVTVNSVTVSGEICTTLQGLSEFAWTHQCCESWPRPGGWVTQPQIKFFEVLCTNTNIVLQKCCFIVSRPKSSHYTDGALSRTQSLRRTLVGLGALTAELSCRSRFARSGVQFRAVRRRIHSLMVATGCFAIKGVSGSVNQDLIRWWRAKYPKLSHDWWLCSADKSAAKPSCWRFL